jgi:hypothetical protein
MKIQLRTHISEETLGLFVQDLWKDQRQLKVLPHLGGKIIRRYSDKSTTIREEYEFIERLKRKIDIKTPDILDHVECAIF